MKVTNIVMGFFFCFSTINVSAVEITVVGYADPVVYGVGKGA